MAEGTTEYLVKIGGVCWRRVGGVINGFETAVALTGK